MSYDVYSANEAQPKLLCTRLTYLLKRLSINISEIGPQSLARGYHDLRVKPVQKITVKQKLLLPAGPDLSVRRPWAGSLLEAPTHPQML